MAIDDEIKFRLDERGQVAAYAPLKFQTLGQLFEDIGTDKETWQEALEALEGTFTEVWDMGGDAYSTTIYEDRVTFSNQYNEDDQVSISRSDAAVLIRSVLELLARSGK